ncbi:MAG: hypothetical protein Q9M40_10620 [Sulfurimonas sp.]|nr:hypothetical protein [Sulfurimonas sp.]
MTPELIPSQDELSDQVELYLTDKGGHVGFCAREDFLNQSIGLRKR